MRKHRTRWPGTSSAQEKTWTPPPARAAKAEQLVEVVRRGMRSSLAGPGIVVEADGDTRARVMFLQKGFPVDDVWSSNLRHCEVDDLSNEEMALLAEHRMSGKGAGEHDEPHVAPF